MDFKPYFYFLVDFIRFSAILRKKIGKNDTYAVLLSPYDVKVKTINLWCGERITKNSGILSFFSFFMQYIQFY
jgi:hypothetical protein